MKPSSGLTRRDLLRQAALSMPAMAFLPSLASAGEDPPAPPPRPAAKPQKVIVVGAGLAGLAAAWELVALGHDVSLFEAQRRAGGRVWTMHDPFSDGLYAEAGAINFGDAYRHLLRYAKTFNLTYTSPQPPKKPLNPVWYVRGKRLVPGPEGTIDWPHQLTDEERKLDIGGLFGKAFSAVAKEIGDPTDPAFQIAKFERYDKMTFAEFFKSQGLSDEAIALLSASFGFGYGWSDGSALHRLLSDVALNIAGRFSARYFEGGSSRLPDAFAAALKERITYGAPLVEVVQEPAKVRAVFRQGGSNRTLEADYLICTVPLPALRKVKFTPDLPAAKRQILAQLDYTPVTRLYLQTRRRFWADQGTTGAASTDLPIMNVNEHPFLRSEDQTRGILECHVKGTEAARLDTLSPDAQLAFALENLEKVHPGFKSQVEGLTTVSWGTDPWTGGGYPWWKPGQLTTWMPELAKPEGRLHFAGEHTSVLGRTQEGALESGNRAAREVHGRPAG